MARLKAVLKWGSVSGSRNDSGDYPVQQHSHGGKPSNTVPWYPYGYDASAPAGTLSLLAAPQADPDGRVAFQGSPGQGPSIAVGEVVVYHPTTGSRAHFKASGDVLVEAGSASITITRDQNITVTTGIAALDVSPIGLVTITGNLVVTGSVQAGLTVTGLAGMFVTQDLQVLGQSTLAGVTSNGVDVGSTHVHVGSPTAPDGPRSNTGTPVP